MSRLRHDLVERRLWIVVALLVAAVVAVPFVVRGHGASAADIVSPPTGVEAVASVGTGSGQAASERSGAGKRDPHHGQTKRDPFAAVTSSSSSSTTSTTSTTTTPGATSATATTGSVASADPTAGPSPVSTAPALGGSSGVDPEPPTGATGTETTTVTVTATTPTTATATTATTAVATTPAPAGTGPWTAYVVDAAIGVTGHEVTRTDLARLTPLPSVRSPKVMFTGVLDHGHEAVFALGDGVRAVGKARCRPSSVDCAAIALAPGTVEQLSWFAPDGATVTESLADRVTATSVRSRTAAQTAFARYSKAGQCELDLAEPVAYEATSGVVSEVSQTACRHVAHAVPFPGLPDGS